MGTSIRPIRKKIVLLLAAYILFSAVIVAFDHHGSARDQRCAICALSSFLSSAVVESDFVAEVQLTEQFALSTEDAGSRRFFAAIPGISYRGPPRPDNLL